MGTSNFYHTIFVCVVLSLPAKNYELCEDDQMACKDHSGCIYEHYICDGTNDCSDESDEERCYDLCVLAGVPNSNFEDEVSFGHGNNRTISCSNGYHYNKTRDFTVKCSQGNIDGEVPVKCYPLPCPSNTTYYHGQNLTFPETTEGKMVESLQTCGEASVQPNLALARRNCRNGSWDEPDLNSCTLITNIEEDRRGHMENETVTEENVEDIARKLETLTSRIKESDIGLVDDILKSVVETNSSSSKVTMSVVKTVDNLMNLNAESLNKFSDVILSLERQISNVQRNSGNFTQVEGNIAIKAIKINPRWTGNIIFLNLNQNYLQKLQNDSVELLLNANESNFERGSASILVNENLFERVTKATTASISHSTVPVSLSLFRVSSLFQTKKTLGGFNNVRQIIASQIISAKIEGVSLTNLPAEAAVVMRFQNVTNEFLKDNETILQVKCVFWVTSQRDKDGYWSDYGCNTTNYEELNETVCRCNHLTSFAVMVGIDKDIPKVFDRFLTMMTMVGSSLSLVGLSACILLLLLVKDLRAKVVSKIHINLFLTLVAFYITFLASDIVKHDRVHCKNIATAVHYFSLAMVCWMSVEAVSMYFLFVKYRRSVSRLFLPISCFLAYGFPIIPVAITYIFAEYDLDHYCFLPRGNCLYYGFLLEVFLLVVFNMIAFSAVVRKVVFRKFLSTNAQSNRATEAIARVQQFVLFWVILGLSWIFGFLSFLTRGQLMIFEILFCSLISLQGFILFIFICAKNPEVKNAICKVRHNVSSRTEHQLNTLSANP